MYIHIYIHLYCVYTSIIHLLKGGAQSQHPNSGAAVVPPPGGPSDPAKYLEGRGHQIFQTQSSK